MLPTNANLPPDNRPWWRSTWSIATLTFLFGVVVGVGATRSDPNDADTAAGSPNAVSSTEPLATSPADPAAPATEAAPQSSRVRVQNIEVESFKLAANPEGQFEGTARVKNVGQTELSADVMFTIFVRGEQVATFDAFPRLVAPGDTVTVDLFSDDAYRPGPYTFDFQVNRTYDNP